jgi:lipopolysaccharide export system permease protein
MAAWWPAHAAVLAVAIAMYFWRLKVNSRYHPLLLWAHFRCAIAFKKAAKP